jgi:hypothetical protein
MFSVVFSGDFLRISTFSRSIELKSGGGEGGGHCFKDRICHKMGDISKEVANKLAPARQKNIQKKEFVTQVTALKGEGVKPILTFSGKVSKLKMTLHGFFGGEGGSKYHKESIAWFSIYLTHVRTFIEQLDAKDCESLATFPSLIT